MKAVVLVEPFHVQVQDIPAPRSEDLDEGEAIIKVKLAGLCGSDLHCYRGNEPLPPNKITMDELHVGDMVVSPFTTSCLQCKACLAGFTSRCNRAQAAYVVVKDAPGTLVSLRTLSKNMDIPDAAYLLCADILPTGYFAALQALTHPNLSGVLTNQTMASIHLVPQRQPSSCHIQHLPSLSWGWDLWGSAPLWSVIDILSRPGSAPMGYANAEPWRVTLLVIDGLFEAMGKTIPALNEWMEMVCLDVDEAGGWVDANLKESIGNGVDAGVVGSPELFISDTTLLRPFGVLASVGVHTAPTFPLTGGDLYDKNVAMCFGRCPVRSILPARNKDGLVDRIVHVDEAGRGCGKVLFRFE
ncbi:chaperonin 10-like protein [Chytridium lagenaria]|nr:chaperonin 10-like protein [Chytridium lagenaria]